MGSGASSAFPEKLTQDHILSICGDNFSDRYFDALRHDNDDTVDRDKFFTIASDPKEQEVVLLFLSFCHSNQCVMDQDTFIKFCRHGKLFSKNKFNRKHLDAKTHDSAKSDLSASLIFPMNYMSFRFKVLPNVAALNRYDLSELITRLSRAELYHAPIVTPQSSSVSASGPIESASLPASAPPAAAGTDNRPGGGGGGFNIDGESFVATDGKGSNEVTTESSPHQNGAIVKIQQVQRYRLAKTATFRRKELKKLESLTLEEKAANTFVISGCPEDEESVKSLFMRYAPSGEMNTQDFLRLCYDTELIPFDSVKVDFTSRDAKFLFQKVIATFFDPIQNQYAEGVFLGKRISFSVFRGSLLPEIASVKTNMLLTDLVRYLADKAKGSQSIGRRMYQGEHGPAVVCLLDPKRLDAEIEEHAKEYEKHV